MEIRVLGPIELADDTTGIIDLPQPRLRALLALLALRSNQPVPTRRLVEQLWEGSPPPAGMDTLHSYIARLRRRLPAGTLTTTADGYVLRLEPLALDSERFTELVNRARTANGDGRAAEASARLREALDLWRGQPFGEWRHAEFASAESARLEQLRLTAIETLVDARLDLGDHGVLIADLEALVAEEPLHEGFHGRLMLALYRSGRQADALAVFRRLRETLIETLGVEPDPVVADLERAILDQRPSLEWSGSAVGASRLPGPTRRSAAPPRPGRFTPPATRRALVPRPRLSDALARRFEHRVVTVVGGAGFGKTTALTQALQLPSAGIDRWLGCDQGDSRASQFADGLARAVGLGPEWTSGPAVESGNDIDALAAAVARAVWDERRPVCIVLDDAHEILDDSLSAELLQAVLDALPENGHLLIASRRRVALRLARLRAHGQLLELGVDDLRFGPGELNAFADLRGTDRGRLVATGGWPALAEITADAGDRATSEFVWEEVLAHLAPARRRALAIFADLGRVDEELGAAALGYDEAFAAFDAFRDLPLVTPAEGGSLIVHSLWCSHLAEELDASEWLTTRRAAARVLVDRGMADDAIALLERSDAWREVLDVFRRVGASPHPAPPPDVLHDWLARLPEDWREEPEALVLAGVGMRASDPAGARPLLERALEQFRARGDDEGQRACLLHLGLISYWSRDFEAGAAVLDAIFELERAGSPAAFPLACVGRAVFASASGESEAVFAALEPLASVTEKLSADLVTASEWLRASAAHDLGHFETAIVHARRGQTAATSGFWPVLEYVRLCALFAMGELTVALEGWPAQLDAAMRTGVRRHMWYSQLAALEHSAKAGRVAHAAAYADALRALIADDPDPEVAAVAQLVELWLGVAAGDEDATRAALRALFALPEGTIDRDEAASLVHLLPAGERPDFGRAVGLGFVAHPYSQAVGRARDGEADLLAGLTLPDAARAIAMLGWSGALELGQIAVATGVRGGDLLLASADQLTRVLAER